MEKHNIMLALKMGGGSIIKNNKHKKEYRPQGERGIRIFPYQNL